MRPCSTKRAIRAIRIDADRERDGQRLLCDVKLSSIHVKAFGLAAAVVAERAASGEVERGRDAELELERRHLAGAGERSGGLQSRHSRLGLEGRQFGGRPYLREERNVMQMEAIDSRQQPRILRVGSGVSGWEGGKSA